jgi:hypothetical protein
MALPDLVLIHGGAGAADCWAVHPIDTCHDVMVGEPARQAQILLERCRTRTSE